jgi:hypothetical protein
MKALANRKLRIFKFTAGLLIQQETNSRTTQKALTSSLPTMGPLLGNWSAERLISLIAVQEESSREISQLAF